MATTTTRKRKIRLGLRSAGISLTTAEFDAWPEGAFDRRFRYELLRGVLVVTPPAGIGERDPNEELGYLLRVHQETHPRGRVIDLTVYEQTLPTTENRRRCDRAIWVGLGRTPNLEVDFPSVVVEFVSGSRRDFRRDYEEKRVEYRQAGALEYWIIDRFLRIMTVYRFACGESRPEVVVSVTEADSYQTDLLPGFVLQFTRLLSKADLWARSPRTKRKLPNKPPEGDPR